MDIDNGLLDIINDVESESHAENAAIDGMVLPSGYRMREVDRGDWAVHLHEVGGSCLNCGLLGNGCPSGMRGDGGLTDEFMRGCACSYWQGEYNGMTGKAAGILAALGFAVIV